MRRWRCTHLDGEDADKRVNEIRAKEVVNTGADCVAVGCPFCMTMMSDGLKTLGEEQRTVKDISEIMLENLEDKMNIAVLIKMVPDTESKLEVNDGTLIDQNFKYMVNPYDEFAVEQAVQFKEAEGGVTLLSLFSEDSSIDTDLRKMLAIGADEIVY